MIKIKEYDEYYKIYKSEGWIALVQGLGNDFFWKDWFLHDAGTKAWGNDIVNHIGDFVLISKVGVEVGSTDLYKSPVHITKELITKSAKCRGLKVEFIND